MGGKNNKQHKQKRKVNKVQDQKHPETSESDFDVVHVNASNSNLIESESGTSANATENSSPENVSDHESLSPKSSDIVVQDLSSHSAFNELKNNQSRSLLSSAVARSSQSTTPVRQSSNNQSTSTTFENNHQSNFITTPISGVSSEGHHSSKTSSSSHSPSKSKDIPIAPKRLFETTDTGLDRSSPSRSYRRNNQFSVGGRSISRSSADALLSKSIPKAIPRRTSQASPSYMPKIATPSSVFANQLNIASSNEGNDHRVILDHQEVNDIIAEHLVQPSDLMKSTTNGIAVSIQGESSTPGGQSFGSMSHSLKGGAITRDIYKWQESREKQAFLPRSSSNPELFSNSQIINSPSLPSVAALREPGGFRRHFIANKAKSDGKPPPNFLTANFIDFLILYGFYGGDVYPSDDDDDEDEELAYSGSGLAIPSRDHTPDSVANDLEISSERTPLLRRTSHGPSQTVDAAGTSEAKAFFLLVKAFVGTGVLFLPEAFSNGGLVFSIVSMVVIGYLTKHCMLLLVETSRAFGGKSFGELGQIIYGEHFKTLVLGSIAVSQMGFCCAYFIFVANNLRDLSLIVSSCSPFVQSLPDWVFVLSQLLLYVPLALVRKIKNFGITSLIADVFILAGLGYIFCYDLYQISSYGAYDVPWMNSKSFPLFIGTAMFAFEGICLMLPIAESMKEPEKFSKVLDGGMLFIGFVFLTIGALGYLAFGPNVQTIVFLNLPKRPEVTTIQFFYALAIMLSFPLCVYPAIRITEQAIFGLSTGKRSHLIKWQKNLYRTLLTSSLGLIAWQGSKNLDKVVSLVGCFACIPLSFIYPALFHSHITTNKWIKLKDRAIVVFGILATIYTTWITIQQWAASSGASIDRCKGM